DYKVTGVQTCALPILKCVRDMHRATACSSAFLQVTLSLSINAFGETAIAGNSGTGCWVPVNRRLQEITFRAGGGQRVRYRLSVRSEERRVGKEGGVWG